MGLLLLGLQLHAGRDRTKEPLALAEDTLAPWIEPHDLVFRHRSSTLHLDESATRITVRSSVPQLDPVVDLRGLPRIESFPTTVSDYLLSTAIGVDPGCIDEDTLQVIELVLMDSLKQRAELLVRTRSSNGPSEFEFELAWGAIVEELLATTRGILGG